VGFELWQCIVADVILWYALFLSSLDILSSLLRLNREGFDYNIRKEAVGE